MAFFVSLLMVTSLSSMQQQMRFPIPLGPNATLKERSAREIAIAYHNDPRAVDFEMLPADVFPEIIKQYANQHGSEIDRQVFNRVYNMVQQSQSNLTEAQFIREVYFESIYPCSIQILIDEEQLPQIGEGELNLANRNLCSIVGLQNISGCKNIKTLYLFGNKLSALNPGVFVELNNLKTLNLSYNQLSILTPGVFEGLKKLEWLFLSGNKFTSLAPGAFDGLNNLQVLYLRNIYLSLLDSRVFAGLNNLEWLFLGGNKFTSLDPGVFEGLKKLKELSLRYNDLSEENKAQIKVALPGVKIIF